jgi:hypothetical protein
VFHCADDLMFDFPLLFDYFHLLERICDVNEIMEKKVVRLNEEKLNDWIQLIVIRIFLFED